MLLTLLLGNLLHFVYDWTGQARWAAYLAATNESTWEHMKLLTTPWVLWSIAELVAALAAETGWTKATIFMMLKRLIAKGAVTMDDSGKFQEYSAAITYADVEPEETESFLSKVYGGSVGMMVSNLVGRGALSEQEIQALKAILDAAEQEHLQ